MPKAWLAGTLDQYRILGDLDIQTLQETARKEFGYADRKPVCAPCDFSVNQRYKTKTQAGTERTMANGKKHVFLSYCHDNQKEVQKLRADLVAAGETVWWDEDILPGQDWKLAIKQAMQDAYAVIVCLSPELEKRVSSGVYPELRDAISAYRQYAPGSIYLVPVRLSECRVPPISIDDTSTLDSLQRIDLFPPNERDTRLKKLIRAIQSTLQHP